MLLPMHIDVTIMANDEKVLALVSINPPSYANNTLRSTYPALLQQPNYILKEFLDANAMAQSIYGKALPSDTYGRLRLKLMGCVVAIVQELYDVENVDSNLSRSDIFYITHVGGVLYSTQHRFCSDLFNIFDVVDADVRLAQLIAVKLPVLICSAPRHPQRLTSADKWNSNFSSKLPTDDRKDQAAHSLTLSVGAAVLDPTPFDTLRPQFASLPLHDGAMVEPAGRSDYVRQLALSVKVCYNRIRSPVQTSMPGPITTSNPAQSSAALFNFSPPERATARFGPINVHFDDWSDYGEPTVYVSSEQQQIMNWGDVRGLRFSGAGRSVLVCIARQSDPSSSEII
jgi:hypothetical protein